MSKDVVCDRDFEEIDRMRDLLKTLSATAMDVSSTIEGMRRTLEAIEERAQIVRDAMEDRKEDAS